MSVSLATLPTESMAAGMSLSQTLQNIGNTLGVAIMITALGEITVGDLGAFPSMWVASAATTIIAVAVCTWVSKGQPGAVVPTRLSPATKESFYI